MRGYIKFMNGLPIWLKIIFAIPALDILWVIYRLARSIEKKNTLFIVIAILLIVIGLPWLWLVDIITLAVARKVLWFD